MNNPLTLKKRESILAWLFLMPSLIGVIIFIMLPFIDAIRRSFTLAMNGTFVGLANYKTVFQNTAFQLAVHNTIRFLLTCIPLLLLLSLLLSVMLSKLENYGEFIKTSCLIPLSIPIASVTFLWKVFFHNYGLLNAFLEKIGQTSMDWLHTDKVFYVLVFSYIWKNCGYNIVLWLAGLNNISSSLYEAASIDGCGPFKKFIYITLPNLRQTLFTVIVLSIINSFKVFREAYLIAGDYPHDSIYMLQHLFSNWFVSLDVQKMCAAAVLMAGVIFIIILLLQCITPKD